MTADLLIRRKNLAFLAWCASGLPSAHREYTQAVAAIRSHQRRRRVALDTDLEREARQWVSKRRVA